MAPYTFVLAVVLGMAMAVTSRLRFNDRRGIGDATINQTKETKGQEVSHLSWVRLGPMAPHTVALRRQRVLSLGAAGSAISAPRPDTARSGSWSRSRSR